MSIEVLLLLTCEIARFLAILTTLIESGVIVRHYHHSVLLVGMDILSRYQVVLIPIQALHYQCLTIFMQGLNSNRNRVREKAVNLLSRFVSAMKEAIVPFQQGILEAVQVCIVSLFRRVEFDCDSNPAGLYALFG